MRNGDGVTFDWRKRAIASFGTSSVVFFPVWREIFTHTGSVLDTDFIEVTHVYVAAHSYIYFFGGLAATLLLAVLLFSLWSALARSNTDWDNRVRVVLAWLAVVWATLFILARSPVINYATAHPIQSILILLGLAALVIVFRRIVIGLSWVGVNLFAAVGLVFVFNAVAGVFATKPDHQSFFGYDKQLVTPADTTDQKIRVVWLVFDEWDQEVAFTKRQDGFQLPNLDHLRERAFFANKAKQAGKSTLLAIPGMTVGKPVTWANETATHGVEIRLEGENEPAYWRDVPNLFDDLRGDDKNVAIMTHYFLSHCRQFAHLTARCWEHGNWWRSETHTVVDGMTDFVASAYRNLPSFGGKPDNPIIFTWTDYQRELERFLEATKSAVSDPKLDFVYSHWMIPHDPFLYDANEGTFLFQPKDATGYWDNLQLLDNVAGELLASLQQSGLAERTVVVFGSDHIWRGSHEFGYENQDHVPFIVAMPGDRKPFDYSPEFSLLSFRELVSRLFAGRIENYEQLAAFLDTYRLDDLQ